MSSEAWDDLGGGHVVDLDEAREARKREQHLESTAPARRTEGVRQLIVAAREAVAAAKARKERDK